MRKRIIELAFRAMLLVLTVVLGLASRRYGYTLPDLVATYAGDTLWATAVFLALGMLLPNVANWKVSILAFSLSVAVELSQLYHAPWIDSLRSTTLGGLLLGFGFLWSDIACYAVGVVLGNLVQMVLFKLFLSPES